MAIHRGVKFFQPKNIYNVNITKNITVQNNCCHGFGMNGSIFGMGMTPMMPMGTPYMDPFQQIGMWSQLGNMFGDLFKGIFSLFKSPETPTEPSNTKIEEPATSEPEATEPAAIKTGDLGDDPKIEKPVTTKYKIEENTSTRETVRTIKYGGPWHYAHYYKDAQNNPIKPSSAAFNEIIKILQGENGLGNVEGNRMQMTMPTTITVGGQTFTLMNQAQRDALGLEGTGGGKDVTYAVKSSTTSATLFKKVGNSDWTKVDTYKDKNEALKQLPQGATLEE